MQIDWGTAIIGLISLILLIAPLVMIPYNRVRKEKKMLLTLSEPARQHNCNITHHEFFGKYIVGMDENTRFLFFFSQKKEESVTQVINLSEVLHCYVAKKTRDIKNEDGYRSVTERVELCFTPTNRSTGETRLEFFDEKTDVQLSGELQFADRWAKRINSHLKSKT